ncbi:hypothetical protein QBC44DRAFT_387184, partial [Cladorrhinum sp. PSN332]
MPPQSFNPYLRGGDTPRRRSRRSRDPFAVNAFVNQADDARAAETADPDADPDDCAGFRDEDRRTPDFEEPEDYGEGLPEDSELAIPHNIIVPDRLKFAKRLQLYEDRIRPNPVTGESKVIKGAWNLLYEAWGLGSKHIHVMERIGIDEALICPRVEQIPDAEVPHRAVQTTATVYPGGQKVEGPWYKPWAWGPFDWMKAIGFTSWTSRGGIAHKRRTLPKELGEDDGWRPPRIGVFKEWPGEEEEDVWFKNTYNHLFLRVESFTKKYFDLGDIDPHQYHGRYVWLEDLPNELLGFAKAAARQDNLVGGWDGLLTVSTYRRCLVMAIFAKVLEKYVFDELLFGGRKDQFLMLSSQDESLVGLEGYQRSDLRARTVRATLRNKTLTPFFWACVDRVSMQIMTLLTPLVLVLDKHFPDSNLNSLRSMHQDIHAIVAQAGYFQIGTAWSHDIFRYSWPFLGQTWDLEQVHYDGGPWELSSARSLQANQKAWNHPRTRPRKGNPHRGEESQDIGEREARAGKQGRRCRKKASKAASKAAARALVLGVAQDHSRSSPTPRLAKVQMVLWPQLQRYSPLGPLDPTTGVCKEGETIVTLSKSQVIYYAGRSDPGREALEARPPLEEHVKDRRRQRIKAWVWPLSYIFSTFLCLLFLHWLGQKFYPPLDRFLTWAEHFFFNLGRTVVLLTAVVILNLVMWFLQVLVTWMKLIFWLAYAFRNLLARLV